MNPGVIIEGGAADWQIFQQKGGFADIPVFGRYHTPGIPEGSTVRIFARLVRENTGEVEKQWKQCEHTGENTWKAVLAGIPAGGLYRIETCLECPGFTTDQVATRGDMIHHVGVGDIYLIAGQSNASGRGKDPVYDPPELGVHLYRNSGKWDLAVHPMNDATGSIFPGHFETANPGHSPYLCFARRLKAELGYPVGLIQTALGGSGLWQWNPAENGELYSNMLEVVRTSGSEIKGVLWYQGCADAFQRLGDTYLDRFSNMVERLRKDLGNEAIPFLTVQLNRCSFPSDDQTDRSWGKVREAQRQAAHRIKNVYVVPANDLKLYDYIHNSSSSDMLLGERTARAALSEIYGKKCSWRAPEVVSAVKTKSDELLLTFSNITHWINLFELRAQQLPFTVEDHLGKNGIRAVESTEADKLLLKLERTLEGNAVLHGAYEMNPGFLIPSDCANLPMLSFYGMEITVGQS